MVLLNNDIIKEIYIHSNFIDLHKFLHINKRWFFVFNVYKQSISKSILKRYNYVKFRKNTNYYQLLKQFYIYDASLGKNLVKCYIDHKYIFCNFIINNVNINNKFDYQRYMLYDINYMVESIRDVIFIKNKIGDAYLLTHLIIWKLKNYRYKDPNDDLSLMIFDNNLDNKYNYDYTTLFIVKSPLILFDMKNIEMNIKLMLNEYKNNFVQK